MSDMSYPTKQESQFMNVQGGEKKVMKKILSVALSTAMAFSMFASVAFGETATTPQAKFDALAAKGVLNGYPDGQAHLEKDLTRAEFAKIVTKLFNLTEVTNKLSYKDKGYNAKNWAVPYIEAVTAANLMQGKDTVKGIFDYNGKVTVEEVATVLFRALKLEAPTTTDNNASTWAKGYAQAVINKGLVAASTNFKANATRSLVVETAYAVSNLSTVPVVASAEALSPTSVLVTFSDKATTTVTLTEALVAGVEKTINFTYNGHDYTAKVTLAAPKVVSVTAPNGKQVVVKFNRPVDASTISETVYGNTTLVDGVVSLTKLGSAPAVTPNTANVVIGADGTDATITFADTEYLKGQYAFTLTDAVKTTAGEKIPAYTQLLTVDDTVAPAIVSVSAVAKATTNKVTVKLSEPVQVLGTIAYVNGAAVNSIANGDSLDELVLTTGTLEAGKTYDVSLLNVKDFAGNYISPNPTKTTVTVVSDTVAPTVASVTVTGENKVKVVFNKSIDQLSLNGSIRLLDANGESKGAFIVSKNDSKTYTLTAPAFSFPSSGTFTGTIVFGTSIRDSLGNTLASTYSQAVTFTKDTAAPTVVSATYGSAGLVVKFSEDVTVAGNAITLISDATGFANGFTVTDGTYSVDGATVTFKNVTGLAAGSYTLRLPAGLVKDKAAAKNANAAVVLPVTITTTTSTDTDKPGANNISNAVVVGTDQRVTFDVYDTTGLNLSTVRDVNNYTLGGKALPAGSYITTSYNGTGNPTNVTASLYIPSASISSADDQDLVINGIKDTAGNTIVPVVKTIKNFVDSVAPTLSSAAVSSDISSRLILTFSEAVEGVDKDDLKVVVNGVEVSAANVEKLTGGTTGSSKKWVLNVPVAKGDYSGNSVLYVENGKEAGVQADEIIAYTGDAAGNLNLAASYVYTITVTVKDETTTSIVDGAGNNITKGTTVSGK
ncbi:Ig-like domain-containing protein [Paenibacillus sp. URB8-2]|uniref:Ig-like domain-containing protein n=1 Tax=Paenibacillus sp. URB8-2 TaxID=2741301 RepID=UPI0015BCA585|nr:Ig-like domain-containing protein [Paenibacillus sp. URB8-2]BCG61361.1 S-layer protein [Paenibacillus sp. URB8-2]